MARQEYWLSIDTRTTAQCSRACRRQWQAAHPPNSCCHYPRETKRGNVTRIAGQYQPSKIVLYNFQESTPYHTILLLRVFRIHQALQFACDTNEDETGVEQSGE